MILAAFMVVGALCGGAGVACEVVPPLPTPIADAVRAVTSETLIAVQDTGTAKNAHAKAGTGLLIASITFSGVAASYTVLCETLQICHEVSPVMSKVVGQGMTRAVIFKASVNAAVHYLVWRYAPEGRGRTLILGVLAAINGSDAIHDGRVVRRALRARGG